MISEIKYVFSDYKYVVLSIAIFVGLLFPLLLISEYIFLEPYFVAHVYSGTEIGLTLIVVMSAMAGLVLPMNIYRIRILQTSKKKMSGGVLGSIIGSAAGACGCGPVGFAIFSTFGSIGATASAFLTNYEIPIRIIAIAILALTLFTTSKSIQKECHISFNNQSG